MLRVRSSYPWRMAIVLGLAGMLAPSGASLAVSSETTVTAVSDAQKQPMLAEGIKEIPDSYLREAASKLLAVVQKYKPPRKGKEKVHVEETLDVCVNGRRVFSAYERYQLLYGVEASMGIRPIVRDLFRQANDKLAWIQTRGENISVLRNVEESMAWRYEQIKSDQPIERPSMQENAHRGQASPTTTGTGGVQANSG